MFSEINRILDEAKSLTINDVFTFIRNIGLCSLVIGFAYLMKQSPEFVYGLPFVRISYIGTFLVFLGFLLHIANFCWFTLGVLPFVQKRAQKLGVFLCLAFGLLFGIVMVVILLSVYQIMNIQIGLLVSAVSS
ncbi:hypothetical protein [Vibrio panuliri]|uniref:Uncharacterized protein n=1 Tax=Vibrio panuliri TaxID=1381081 RepID=A0ABX3FN73_9VIBR|nr:hypothetical protein [Vibrio panuliri]KAB1454548.1 hypothetical protein F7O85_16875 [Vibrio panuliri]OLQ95674.1 hypothetical protein BIY20_20845 [Vibrio panuliri]